MKLLVAFLLLSISVQAQPFKGAEKIIVTVDTTNIMNRLSMALYEKGYSISQKDEGLRFVASSAKQVKGIAALAIHALVKDSTVIFSGSFSMNLNTGMINTNGQSETLTYKGMKGSPIRDAWAELEKFAKLFNDELRYQ